MTVNRHPAPGTIVRIDLSEGFRPPEIGKRRPAVVLSPLLPGRPQMCTIVPLSTTPPSPVLPHHMQICFDPPLPPPYSNPVAWLKGDIVLTVAFRRLRYLFAGHGKGSSTGRHSPVCSAAYGSALDSVVLILPLRSAYPSWSGLTRPTQANGVPPKKPRNVNAPQIARVGRVKPDHDDEEVTTAIMRTAGLGL